MGGMETTTLNSLRDAFYRHVLDVADELDLAVPMQIQAIVSADGSALSCDIRIPDEHAHEVPAWAAAMQLEKLGRQPVDGIDGWDSVYANSALFSEGARVHLWSKCDRK